MIVRRLILLFVLLVVMAGLIALRLGQLQIAQAQRWQAEAKTFIDRPHILETARGTIMDRLGRPVATDAACYDLAIDYRAMSLDDRWITQQALTRLTADGITSRAERRAKIVAYKAQIADQILGNPEKHIEGIAAAIARECNLPLEEILARMQTIRERMQILRQSRWSLQYDRNTDEENLKAGAYDLDAGLDIKEEQTAHTIVPAVSYEAAFYFEKHSEDYPGLVKIDSKRRTYPYGPVAAQTIGVLRVVDKNKLDAEPFDSEDESAGSARNLHGYLPMDQIGGSGVERMAEATLRGSRGVRVIDTSSDTVIAEKSHDPVEGQDVQLSLDIELQRDVEATITDPSQKLLIGQDGLPHPIAMVILDAANSDILSMISLPSYDPNTYDQHVVELNHDLVGHPLTNRVIQAGYPPGSTVKGLIATAALTEKVVTPDETVLCRGYLFTNQPEHYRCLGTHGDVSMERGLEVSCNVYFYTMGMRLGYDRLATWYHNFGFGSSTGTGLAEEFSGRAPSVGGITDPDVAKRMAIFLGIGQGPLQVTPLQMANAYATLARGGVAMAPRLVQSAAPRSTSQVPLAADALPIVQQGLFEVVHGDHGTARKAMQLVLPVAGKTGTATATRPVFENGQWSSRTDNDAWFVCYAPADHPKVVIAALMEFGGHGGVSAVPMAKQAIIQLERHGYLPKLDVP